MRVKDDIDERDFQSVTVRILIWNMGSTRAKCIDDLRTFPVGVGFDKCNETAWPLTTNSTAAVGRRIPRCQLSDEVGTATGLCPCQSRKRPSIISQIRN